MQIRISLLLLLFQSRKMLPTTLLSLEEDTHPLSLGWATLQVLRNRNSRKNRRHLLERKAKGKRRRERWAGRMRTMQVPRPSLGHFLLSRARAVMMTHWETVERSFCRVEQKIGAVFGASAPRAGRSTPFAHSPPLGSATLRVVSPNLGRALLRSSL